MHLLCVSIKHYGSEVFTADLAIFNSYAKRKILAYASKLFYAYPMQHNNPTSEHTSKARVQDWHTWQSLAFTTSHIFAIIDQQLRKECHISLSDFDVLATLRRHDHNQATMACLTATVVVTLSGLSRSVSRLEQAGLVNKEPSEQDKRSMLITLTEQGQEVLKQAMKIHNCVINREVMAKLSLDQRDQLAAIVSSITQE